MSDAPTTLSAQNLTCHYGHRVAISDVSLTLARGEVLGLLGHNGAGKSTTLQMLAGVLAPDRGHIEISGIDLARRPLEARARIGFLPETPPLYRDMRVDDYLIYAARLRRMSRDKIAQALDETRQRCGLQEVRRRFIGTLSKGYQQRVGIAQAIIHAPDVVILDEPTVGLDPAQIRDIRALIRELGDAHSVILSTHLLNEAENLCDRIDILHEGRIAYNGGAKNPGNTETSLEDFFLRITGTHEESAP
jgi:ABC-2 type transport system ATP-binding protein